MKNKDFKYIDAKTIIYIHEKIRENDPSTEKGLQSFGSIEAASQRPQFTYSTPNGVFTAYSNIYSKAGALFEALCQYHGFCDGNKRTAYVSTYHFMYINGRYLVPVIQLIRFSIEVADENISTDLHYITKWLRRHSSRFKWFANLRLRIHLIGLSLFPLVVGTFFPKYSSNKLNYWLATDIDPKYKEEWMKRLEFGSKKHRNHQ